ncbi:unnamed protein product, partial [marine sediment metagenome]
PLIGSLLEVGTGFHPELTGHENVYLYGTILGMDRWEVSRKFDEIVAFAGLEKFVDTPVKRYSSGMYMRLAFAVAAHLDPEILLVDEVLAVGDIQFQKKCLGKLQNVSKEGRTVLFVSHNMDMINRLCQRGILLKNGHVDFEGNASDAVQQYLRSGHQEAIEEVYYPEPKEKNIEAYIYKIRFENIDGTSTASFPVGRPWQIRVFFRVKNNFKSLFVTCGMHDKTGPVIRSTWGKPKSYAPGNYEVILREKNLMLTPGEYQIYLALDTGRNQ